MKSKFELSSSLFCLFITLVGPSAMALVGKNVITAKESENKQVCKIEIFSAKAEPKGELSTVNCTGALVSPTKVFTAAHCFGKGFSLKDAFVSVSCGGIEMSEVKRVDFPDSKGEDFASITLTKKNSLSLGMVVANPKKYFDLEGNMVKNANCNIIGYGKSNPDLKGPLASADLSAVKIFYDSKEKMIRLIPLQSLYLATSVDKGDSGAPLFCTLKGNKPELLATVTLYHYVGLSLNNRDFNLAHPSWLHLNENTETVPD